MPPSPLVPHTPSSSPLESELHTTVLHLLRFSSHPILAILLTLFSSSLCVSRLLRSSIPSFSARHSVPESKSIDLENWKAGACWLIGFLRITKSWVRFFWSREAGVGLQFAFRRIRYPSFRGLRKTGVQFCSPCPGL